MGATVLPRQGDVHLVHLARVDATAPASRRTVRRHPHASHATRPRHRDAARRSRQRLDRANPSSMIFSRIWKK